MIENDTLLTMIARTRPVGSAANERVLDLLEEEFFRAGYGVDSIPLACKVWTEGLSTLTSEKDELTVFASPFSKPIASECELLFVSSSLDFQRIDCQGKLLVLFGEMTREALQPKEYPFYYPEEHKAIVTRLEEQKPLAVLAVTGKSPSCGLDPFPFFFDGNLEIPTAYISEQFLPRLRVMEYARLTIKSTNRIVPTRQLIAHKSVEKSLGKIVVCAHVDSQYGTDGALDNAVGVVVLLRAMMKIQAISLPYDIDFVPFNTEEYFGADGELAYLAYLDERKDSLVLVINIDSPCHKGSKVAVSSYNPSPAMVSSLATLLEQHKDFVESGPQWYAGDHSAFLFRGIPCLALTSSDLFEDVLSCIHTQKDTTEQVDTSQISRLADFLVEYIRHLE